MEDVKIYALVQQELQQTDQYKRVLKEIRLFYDDVEQGVAPNHIVAIAAPSGAGKTQMGITLSASSELKVLHVAMATVPGKGRDVENTRTSSVVREGGVLWSDGGWTCTNHMYRWRARRDAA